jgi:hypothetical protein
MNSSMIFHYFMNTRLPEFPWRRRPSYKKTTYNQCLDVQYAKKAVPSAILARPLLPITHPLEEAVGGYRQKAT